MRLQRHLLGWVIAAGVAGSAAAQTTGTLRWRAGSPSLGLQAGQVETRLPCASFAFSCTDTAALPLYSNGKAPRSLSMQVASSEGISSLRRDARQGLNVSLVGKAGIAWDLGVYGRVGTTFNRAGGPTLAGMGPGEGGLTYGVGLSWDFSRRGSAALGLDSYDVRGGPGEGRDLRTSLGLQWRY